MTDRPRKEPLPLEALDDPPAFPVRAPNAPTKPVDFAPPPPVESSVESVPNPESAPAHSPSGGGATKPVAYVPPKLEDSERDARGYAVEGFSRKYKPEDSAVHVEIAPRVEFRGIGDRDKEYLHIRRGKLSAWPHVVAAFLIEAAAFGGAAYAIVGAAVDLPRAASGAIGAAFGLLVAWAIFRDRWRCIEAFASRYALEPAGLALLWVPAIAWAYATLRGAKKLVRR